MCQRGTGVARGKRAGKQAGGRFSRLNGPTEAAVLLCPPLSLIADAGCLGARCRGQLVCGGGHTFRKSLEKERRGEKILSDSAGVESGLT